ncbi:uroporphyrinogen-III synthase [Sphingomonas sp.]|uniref:uroporphyrinogen-III synthase n=1 Tax=Sphingomonas sp. TaxID=28214 RepID=UPI0025ECA5EB|nr:uroporphyrinogen-III synthase [Sphingomonas sp.]
MRQLLLLRPEPGLSASAERARQLGLKVIACPLFRVEPVEWQAPDPANYDALLLTSANAVRFGGAQLDTLKALPVHAVGEATAEAARSAGFEVASTGTGNVADLLATLPIELQLLHLAGYDHREAAGRKIDRIIVYRSAAIDDPGIPVLDGLVVAVHSPRAAARLAELAGERHRTPIAAISEAAAEAAGPGWERIEVAEQPDDSSLLALAAMLCHTSPRQ